ncbi:CHAT domain-containing protein [Catalinimonas alkaloidigena]|uniref:CHAT domain-containing protein n=1 Tax=Catalinimonas alkaloidigena TaxID=1075417 RepID=UPI00240626E8|nr:CHAT domain-containing tetratricopeptide repeat protein [Catalinimonas alkaloidigena]MDF9798405.1 CHAT domain-containing protein [Catalinimonas alkaloidigena]
MKALPVFFLWFVFSMYVAAHAASENPAKDLLKKAQSLEEKKEVDSAAFYYLRAAEAFQKNMAWQESINVRKKAGNLYFSRRMSDEAIANFNYLLDTLHSYLSDTLKAELYFKNGISHARLARFVDALNHMKQSCQIREQLLDPHDPILGESFHMLGRLYFTIGNYQQSLNYQQKYLEVNQHNYPPDHMEVSDALHFVGLSYSRLYEHELALEYYFKSADIVEKAGKKERWALTHIYNNIGLVYGRQNMHEKELEYFLKALAMKKELGMNISDTYHNIGKTYIDLERYTQAQDILHEALRLKIEQVGERHTTVAGTLYYLAELYVNQAQYDSAIYYAEKALSIEQENFGNNGTSLAASYRQLATIYQKQQLWRQSLDHLQKGQTALVKYYDSGQISANPSPKDNIIDPLSLLRLMQQKSEVLLLRYAADQQTEDLRMAYQTSKAATELIEHTYANLHDSESRTFLADHANKILELALQTAYMLQQEEEDTQYLELAFQLIEKNKAQLLLENITSSQWKSKGAIADTLLEQEQEVSSKLAYYEKLKFEEESRSSPDSVKLYTYNNQIFALHRTQESLNQSIRLRYPQYYHMRHEQKFISLQQAQKDLLQEDEVLVEYFQGDSAIYYLAVSSDQVSFYRNEIKSLPIKPMLNGLQERDYQTYTQAAHRLYNYLLLPVLRDFSEKKLIIIPDHQIGYIPFESLLVQPPSSNPDYKSLQYLMLEHTISYQYSANLLASTQQTSVKEYERSFAGYAPTFSKQKNTLLATRSSQDQQLVNELEALPYAEEEVRTIAQMLNGEAHISETATEKNFKEHASNSWIIHLASHTLINDRNPLYSKLVFAPEDNDEEDGLLHTYELYNMQLKADMVTLSACNTGVGKIQKGEGIISLARGFMYAGVPNVLMSLWAVSDRSTSQLMQNFYQALNKGSSKAEALRTAKLQYLEQADANTAAPYYWSGFVLISNNQDPGESNFPVLFFLLPMIALILAGWFYFRKKAAHKTT